MKKILFAAMAATMLAACTQNEELENATSNKEMKFNTAVMSTTRATVTTSSNFRTFKLHAYTGTDNAKTVIDGETFNSTDGTTWNPLTTGAKFYWPGTDAVNFYGYSVSDIASISFDKSTNSFSYEVASSIADQKDLLVAEKEAKAADNNGSVLLAFEHALTKISFKVQGEGTSQLSYTVSEIAIEALPSGTYKYGTGNGWTATAGNKTTYSIKSPTTIKGGETATNITESDGNATLMLIPQTGAKIIVTYTLTNGDITIPTESKEFTITDAWTPGQNISYLIKLDGAKEINVTSSLATTWDNAPDSDTTLPTAK